MNEDIITVDELAEYMRVNRKTIYEAVKAGEIPGARRIGGTIRIHKPTVLTWLEKGEEPKQRKRAR
jgi:excisionase family DNA binding protein